MARKRFIAPSFFVHSDLFDLEERTKLPVRLAFAGLWCQADRRGLFAWKPRELKLAVLPYDPCDFVAVLEALIEAGFIERHMVNGQQIGRIPSFERWQTFHRNEAPSDLPDPTDGEATPPDGGPEPSNGRRESSPSIAVTAAVAVAGTAAAAAPARAPRRPASRPAVDAARSHSERLDALRAVAEPHEADALEQLLAGHSQPEQLVSELYAIASGTLQVRGKTSRRVADARCVMRAVAEMAANDKPFEVPLFRGYVRRVADRPAEPVSLEEQQAARVAAERERQALVLRPAERPRTPEEIAAGAAARGAWRSQMLAGPGAPMSVGDVLERVVPRRAIA